MSNCKATRSETKKDRYQLHFHYIPANVLNLHKNFLFHPQENATHYSIHILGISGNITFNRADEQLETADSRAAPYCAVC
jgi:hypothetical protein